MRIGYIVCTYYPFNEGAPLRMYDGFGWTHDTPVVYRTFEIAREARVDAAGWSPEDRATITMDDMHIQRINGTVINLKTEEPEL